MLSPVLFSSKSDEHGTPDYIYQPLHKMFNFTLDPCTTPANPLGTPNFYTKDDDGLSKSWDGRVFVNYPYGRKSAKIWLKKIITEWTTNSRCELICVLAPNRSDTPHMQEAVNLARIKVELLGRVKFVGSKQGAPFPSILLIYARPGVTLPIDDLKIVGTVLQPL